MWVQNTHSAFDEASGEWAMQSVYICTLRPGTHNAIFHTHFWISFLPYSHSCMHKMPLLSIQSLVQMSSTHIFRECERSVGRSRARANIFSIRCMYILFISFKAATVCPRCWWDEAKEERMKKKLKRKCKKKTKFSCSYCYIHSWLLFLFGCSCCLFLAHIHPAQFICRLLLFIMLESYTTSRRREMQYCVFIVCTYCCELFLFPPIFSMCLRYVGRIV